MAKAPAQIRSLARAHTESALRVLAGIMNQEEAPAAARVSAAQALLDRGWGKATQPVEHGLIPIEDMLDRLDGKTPENTGEPEE